MVPSPPPMEAASYSSTQHVTVLLIAILVTFFLLASFFVCLCKCFMESLFTNWRLHGSPTVNVVVVNPNPGLDPAIVQSFPTFAYSNVKKLRREKYGLECAICLVEFEDDSVLRLLTFCYHVFHQECIDLWLESHKTCPVCRQDLTTPPEAPPERSPITGRRSESTMPSIRESNESLEHAVSIDIREDDKERTADEGSSKNLPDQAMINVGGQENVERFSRSHSTGHSITRNDNVTGFTSDDKYTLRFQEHVKVNITRGHTGSCITFGDISNSSKRSKGVGFGEVSGSSK